MSEERRGVDAELLARVYATYTRVVTGVTRYLRDETDIYSAMMDKLRQDGMKDPQAIDAFLAVQRVLVLHGDDARLREYTDRIVFMLAVQGFVIEGRKKDGKTSPPDLPWLHDPRRNPAAAAWWRALSTTVFPVPDEPYSLRDVFRDVNLLAADLFQGNQDPLTGNLEPHDAVEDSSTMKETVQHLMNMKPAGKLH